MLIDDAIKNYGEILYKCMCTKFNGDSMEISSKFSSIGWIRIKDAMPEFRGDILRAATPLLAYSSLNKNTKVLLVNYYEDEKCWKYFTSGNGVREEITHWMPLPKPPMEKNNEI
tara:strand:- start:218 stop:559 length:342 start_codon:yes stop_codon:yes gene_type:complete